MRERLRGVANDIRSNRLLTARAIVIGWAVLIVLFMQLALPLARLDELLFFAGWGDYRWFWKGGSGWISHFLIGGGLNAAAGWIVGRLHRSQKVAMVTAFFASRVLIGDGLRLIDVLMNPDGGNRWQGLGISLLDFVFMSLPILAAGIWGVRSSKSPEHIEVVPNATASH